MERSTLIALVVGTAIGAASHSALTSPRETVRPQVAAVATPVHASWNAEHAAIPRDTEGRDPAPTF